MAGAGRRAKRKEKGKTLFYPDSFPQIMSDLEIAKKILREETLSLVIVREGKILVKSREKGVVGLSSALDKIPDELAGASVADTVVGKAAAILCIHGKVKELHAGMMSQKAIEILDSSSLEYEFEWSVPFILNRDQSGPCIFEALVEDCDDIPECAELIKNKVLELIK